MRQLIIGNLKLVLSIFLLIGPVANARPWFCPELEGTYGCHDGRVGYKVHVQQKDVGWHLRYVIESVAEGSLEVVTDDETRPYENGVAKGTVSARCVDNQLRITFLLKDRQGLNLNVEDTIYLDTDHDALVHIRHSLTNSQIPMNQNVTCKRIAASTTQ